MVTIESIWRGMYGTKYTCMVWVSYSNISLYWLAVLSQGAYILTSPPPPLTHTHTSSSPLLSPSQPPHPHTITAVKILSSPSATRYTVRTTITSAAKGSATDVNVPPVTQQPNQPGVWEPSALSNLWSQSVCLTVTLTSVGVLNVLIWQVPTQSGAEKSTVDKITTYSASECCSQWVNLTSCKGVKEQQLRKSHPLW